MCVWLGVRGENRADHHAAGAALGLGVGWDGGGVAAAAALIYSLTPELMRDGAGHGPGEADWTEEGRERDWRWWWRGWGGVEAEKM